MDLDRGIPDTMYTEKTIGFEEVLRDEELS
jgi:hypothetical protein